MENIWIMEGKNENNPNTGGAALNQVGSTLFVGAFITVA